MIANAPKVVVSVPSRRRSTHSLRTLATLGAAVGAMVFLTPRTYAANATWTGTAGDGLWVTDGNWNPAAPGDGTGFGTTSTDTATFNNNVSTAVTIDNLRNIGSILFDTSGVGAFTFGGGPLQLTGAGSITMNGTVTNGQTFNNNFQGPVTGNYAFNNNSTTPAALMNINGNYAGALTTGTSVLTLGGSGNGVFKGVISNGVAGGLVGLTKSGTGTWTLTNANTYTGPTLVNTGGTLKLDFSAAGAPATNIVASGSQLQMSGGTLNIVGSNTGSTTQTFNGMAIIRGGAGAGNNQTGNGTAHLNVLPGTGQTATVVFTGTTIGNLATSVNGQVHEVIQFGTTGTIQYPAALSAPLLTNNHNNGYATFGPDDWAATDATGKVVAATYTNFATGLPTTVTATTNANITGSNAAALTNNGLSLGSLRFADAANDTLTLGTGTLTFGGILMTSTSGGATITGGTLRANRGGATTLIDFNVIQNSTLGDLTIASAITIPSGSQSTFTKSGPGRVILTNTTNGWGGDPTRLGTSINEGILSASSNAVLGTAGAGIGFAGGTLEITGTMSLDTGGTFRPLVLNTAAPVSITGTNTLTVPGVISGTGPLVKTNTGTMTVTGVNTFTGGTNINAGKLLADNATNALGTGTVNINNTGTLGGIGTITAALNVNSGGHLAPGDSAVGTLSATSATVNSGGKIDFEINPGGNDLLNLTAAAAANALTANSGAGFNVFTEGGTAPWTINGTYNLINVVNGGTVTGLTNLAPLNQTGTVVYSLAQNANFITLTISGGNNAVTWNINGSGSWNSATSWTPQVIPHNPGDAATLGGIIGAPATVALDGAQTVGSLTFNSTNSYTVAPGTGGTLTFNSGTSGNAFLADKGGNHFITAPVTLTSNTSATITNSTDVLTISGAISGPGGLTVGGAGTLALTGTNSWGGGTTISSGTLQVGNGTTAGTIPAGAVTDNGTLAFNHSDPLTVTNVISGSGGVTQVANSVLTLGAANSYTGPTNVNAGSIKIGVANGLGTGALTVASGSLLDLNGNNASVAGLNGSGTIDSSTAGTMTLTISNAGTFTGLIQNTNGTIGITKTNNATQAISGNNTYSGGTTINGGSIRITNSTTGAANAVTAGPLGTGTVTVNNGPGLVFGGASNLTFGNTISVGSGASANPWVDVVDPGINVTVSGNVTLPANSSAQYRLQTTGAGSSLILTGTNTVGSASATVVFNQGIVTFAGNGSLNFNSTAQALLGRATFAGTDTAHMTLTVQDSASIKNAGTGGISLLNLLGALPSGMDVIVRDNGILSSGPGPMNLMASAAFSGAANAPTYQILKGTGSGGTLEAGSFAFNATSTIVGNMTIDGGILSAGANDPSGGQWFPALNLSVTVGANGVTLNSNNFNATFAQSFSDGGSGGGLTKTGAGGSMIVSASNSYIGATKAVAGLLEFTAAGGYGSTSSISAAAGAAVGLETSSLDPAFLNLLIAAPTNNAGGLALATPDAAANLDFTTGTLSNPKLVGMSVGAVRAGVTYTGTITPASNTYRLGGGGTLTLPNANQLTGSNAVAVTNGGAVNLAAANNYTGNTTVDFGTTLIASNTTGSATSSGTVTLNSGTLASGVGNVGIITGNVLAGTGAHTIAPGGIGTIGTFTIGGLTSSTLSTLNFDVGTGSGVVTTGDLLTLGAGTVSIGAGTHMSFGGTTTIGNDYRLIGGSIGGISLANFTLAAAPSGQAFSLSTSVDPGFIDLVVGASALTWNNTGGTGDGVTWDTTNQNWNNGTAPGLYADGVGVTFNDTNNGHFAVTINSTVSPSSVTVNTAGAYTFSGTGGIAGTGGLTMSGTGSLTISTVNTYTGNTAVNGGTLTVASGASIASNNVTVASGATLNVNGTLAATSAMSVTGAANFGGNTSTTLVSNKSVGAITVNPAGLMTLQSSAVAGKPLVLTASSLTFGDATAHLDLTNNELLVTDTLTNVRSEISTGKLKTSTAGLAVGSLSVTGGKIEARATLLGDTNLDGAVDVTDLGNLASSYGANTGAIWVQGDTNYDGAVDVTDLGNLASNYGGALAGNSSVGAAAPSEMVATSLATVANGGGTAAVPEPASLGVVGIGALAALSRRRRRRA